MPPLLLPMAWLAKAVGTLSTVVNAGLRKTPGPEVPVTGFVFALTKVFEKGEFVVGLRLCTKEEKGEGLKTKGVEGRPGFGFVAAAAISFAK